MNGIAKSPAQEVLHIVTETIVDAYALIDSITHSSRKSDLALDIQYVEKRFANEGLTFLTTTLPLLGDWFDRFVCGDKVERVVGFAPYNGLFPCFLRPFWIYVEREFVTPRACAPDIEGSIDPAFYQLVRLLRTILHGCKKLEVPYTCEQEQRKLDSFLEIEDELTYQCISPTPVLWYAQTLIEEYMSGYVPTCNFPRHGPGSVAGGERHNQKWKFSTLFASLHAEFPYYEYIFGVRSTEFCPATQMVRSRPIQLASKSAQYRAMVRVAEPEAKLLFVPKDSRGPRIISCEPAELMYIQQGVSRHLMNYIERHSYTKGHVNFIDQEINASMALEASATKAWSTIDLSDASDRVSCQLISFLFPRDIVRKWFALRSTATKLPSGASLPLRKFAPMGSALCFPVESLVFWALAVACIWECTNDLTSARDAVFVYGDDIIVKDEYYHLVVRALESVDLKVNTSKSFHGKSPFRESCGIEAINGFNVTPLRIRKLPPQRPSDGKAIVAYIKYAENSAPFCARRSLLLIGYVERYLGPIPRTPVPQAYLSMVVPSNFWDHSDFKRLVWDPSLCYYTTRLWTAMSRKHLDSIDSWSRLQHDLLSHEASDPSLVVDRSSTQIRKRKVSITYLDRGGPE
jgi:hypothetical protein